MIKLSILMVRRPGMEYSEYLKHWGGVHGEVFASQPATKKHVRKYVQNHPTQDVLDGPTPSKFAGIAEIWFDNMEGAREFFATSDYKDNVIPDEELFMDRSRCELLFTHEKMIIG